MYNTFVSIATVVYALTWIVLYAIVVVLVLASFIVAL